MPYTNYMGVKLGKFMVKLKRELRTCNSLLTERLHPFKPTFRRYDLLQRLKNFSKLEAITFNQNKHIFSQVTNNAKLIVNSSNSRNFPILREVLISKKLLAERAHALTPKLQKNLFAQIVDYSRLFLYPNYITNISKLEHADSIKSLNIKASMNVSDSLSKRPSSSTSQSTEQPKNPCAASCISSSPTKVEKCGKSGSPGRSGFHKETEDAINQQILGELEASYAYLSMACYFGRTEVALPGCQGYFMRMHEEEHGHAMYFINYLIMRGGHVRLLPLPIPENQDWKSIANAFTAAIKLEKSVKQKLTELYNVAEKHHDLSVMEVVSSEFIIEQERSICELARLLRRITRMGESGTAEFLFDQEMHRTFVRKTSKNKADGIKFDKDDKSNLYV